MILVRNETLERGQQVVKVFRGQEAEKARFRAVNDKTRRLHLRMTATHLASSSLVQVAAGLAMVMLMYIATRPSMLNEISAGTFTAIFTAMVATIPPLKRLTGVQSQVQKGIAMLAVLGAVAPLLGLLGTVTGMIDTFRVITLFGTSDPKLMSGGISEALVTTELGLAVAIPIMLLHTYLSRKSDHLIGDMESKAVQMTNIIDKQKIVGAS